LTVFFLTEHNNLFIWYEDIMQFTKVHVSPSFLVQITSIIACNDDLLIHANQHLFKAAIQHKVPKMYQVDSEYKELKLKRDIAQFLCAKVSIKRLSNLANVEKAFCDPDGESFIALLGQSCVKIEEPEKAFYNFTELLDADMFAGSRILDVKFILKNQEFHTNRFLVASRCEHLKNMMKNGEFEIIDEKMTSEMFQCILTWIYKESLDDDDLESIIGRVKDEELIKNLLKDFYDILMEWKLYQVLNSLKKKFQKYFTKSENDFNNSSPAFKWFNIENFPELYDVTIQLEDNQILRAHKVILMMRIEYFKMMFYHTWSEESVVDLKHVPIIYMRPIIQFAYDNNIQALSDSNFSDIFLYNMCTILDQYLIEDLKNVFETIIIRKVNLKNCAENLDFSITYNCHKLKEHCMSFICLNLPRILESGVLDILDISTLRELNIFYRKFYNFETKSNHILTPAFDAPTDEEIELRIEGFDLIAYCAAAEHQATLKKTPKSKSRLSKSEMSKRNYEKEGMKTLKSEETSTTVASPKSTAIDIIVRDEIDVSSSSDNIGTWQKKIRERKDSGRKKGLTASKVNEIVKNEVIQSEQMVDLKSLRKSISEDVEIIDSSPRNAITLADFCVKSKKKEILTPQKVEILETKPKLAWNMDNIELKPSNSQNSAELFKSSTPPKKKSLFPSPKPQKSIEKNFNSIIRDERKEKTNYEKIKSKSLILTQIEEQAIIELSQFYNIDNIFDESITIERKVHKASQNLSQWTHHQTTNGA
jgi:inhibitor of Bruton tyrosine kinase